MLLPCPKDVNRTLPATGSGLGGPQRRGRSRPRVSSDDMATGFPDATITGATPACRLPEPPHADPAGRGSPARQVHAVDPVLAGGDAAVVTAVDHALARVDADRSAAAEVVSHDHPSEKMKVPYSLQSLDEFFATRPPVPSDTSSPRRTVRATPPRHTVMSVRI